MVAVEAAPVQESLAHRCASATDVLSLTLCMPVVRFTVVAIGWGLLGIYCALVFSAFRSH